MSSVFRIFAPDLKKESVLQFEKSPTSGNPEDTGSNPYNAYMWAAVLCMGAGVWRYLRADADGGPLSVYRFNALYGSWRARQNRHL